jgi:hypothetical protein
VCYVLSAYALGSHSPYTYALTHMSTDPTPTPSTYTLRDSARRTPVKTTTKGDGARGGLGTNTTKGQGARARKLQSSQITPWNNGIRCTHIAACQACAPTHAHAHATDCNIWRRSFSLLLCFYICVCAVQTRILPKDQKNSG